jgi:hypothetical protein
MISCFASDLRRPGEPDVGHSTAPKPTFQIELGDRFDRSDRRQQREQAQPNLLAMPQQYSATRSGNINCLSHCEAFLPNAPRGLNPSSPIFLLKAASIATRTFFWLVSKLRRGRRPIVVGGKLLSAFITDKAKGLGTKRTVSLCIAPHRRGSRLSDHSTLPTRKGRVARAGIASARCGAQGSLSILLPHNFLSVRCAHGVILS